MTHGTKRDKTQKNFLLLFNSFQLLIRSNSVGVHKSDTLPAHLCLLRCVRSFCTPIRLLTLSKYFRKLNIFKKRTVSLLMALLNSRYQTGISPQAPEILLPLPSWQSLHTYPSTHSFLLRQQLSNSQLYH